jgi:hypothetical protein
VEAYITSRGTSNKPMGPLWTPLGPSLLGSIILWSPCLTRPPLHPWLSLPLAPLRPIIWGTLGDNHIYRGHCKPTTLIGLHSNLTTSPSPWSPFSGGLMVDIFATFLPKISISNHNEWGLCKCWKDKMYTSICKVIKNINTIGYTNICVCHKCKH